jgi:hypothetical protein
MYRAATLAALLLLLAACPSRRERDDDVECGPGTELVNDYCLPIGNVDDDDDDDVAPDDDDVAPDDDDVVDDDDAAPDDDDATDDDDVTPPEETFPYGICNNLRAYEDIVELYVTPLGADPADEVLQGAVIEWYGCATINLVPHTYTLRVVDEFGWQYGVSNLPLSEPAEFWFGYEHQL